ncbi:copper resistance protein B [Chitinasiproducens palmae]|uniref:Copper resistance protein B n=1 Tax=Chitinasiproducens palmae TaxID=1770053 RepID=A0A1H2PR60_9BURK|nr:copper resistance protein B [Chitinasiproducens palmae]SDV49323.1 copper resistance protein B [Chitinasiproducens palmae]
MKRQPSLRNRQAQRDAQRYRPVANGWLSPIVALLCMLGAPLSDANAKPATPANNSAVPAEMSAGDSPSRSTSAAHVHRDNAQSRGARIDEARGDHQNHGPHAMHPTRMSHASGAEHHGAASGVVPTAPITDIAQGQSDEDAASTVGAADPQRAGDMRAALAANRILPGNAPPAAFADPSTGVEFPGADMHDMSPRSRFLADRLEYVQGRRPEGAWDVEAYIGGDLDRLVLRSEGEANRDGSDGRIELLYSRAISAFWNTELGVRHDFGSGPNRQWLAVGVAGTAPYWIETQLTAYAGPAGRTALHAMVEHDARLTQRLILTPRLEAMAYGRADPARERGAGLSDLSAAVRLRYDIDKRFAPYIGFEMVSRFGQTARWARQAGERAIDPRLVVGVRFWF